MQKAWTAIQRNARTSKSETTKHEIAEFAVDADAKLKRIQRELQLGTFKFPPAKGVKIPKDKKNSANFRPLVIAKVESRIVQRAVHDVLVSVPAIKAFVHTPHSFGGIRREADSDLSAVPAAIKEVLKAIDNGGSYIIRSDITAFFTRISKSAVTQKVRDAVEEDDFVKLFESAIRVELENMDRLKSAADKFPTHDIGVAQGNSLSPLLGNIVLYDFDAKMNKRTDARCIRYIDDFIIIAPNRDIAENMFSVAQASLQSLGMSLSISKTQRAHVVGGFEFLGIEFGNGFLRPAKKSQQRVLDSVANAIADSIKAFRENKDKRTMHHSQSLIETLGRISGIMKGWGKHYYFCNDNKCFKRLDDAIEEKIKHYLGAYREARLKADDADRWRLLGVEALSLMDRTPFEWPKSSRGRT